MHILSSWNVIFIWDYLVISLDYSMSANVKTLFFSTPGGSESINMDNVMADLFILSTFFPVGKRDRIGNYELVHL